MRSHGSSTPAGRARSAIRRLRGSARLLVLVALVLVVAVAASVAVYAKRRRPVTLVEELAEIEMPRVYSVRFSVPTKFRPCHVAIAPGRIPSAECPDAATVQVPKDLEGRISTQADSSKADAIHADALLDFELDDVHHTGLWRIIERLQMLYRGGYRPADSLADLSAAYLVRAGREQQMLDLVRALVEADKALVIDSTLEAALFNRALALQALMWDNEASKAWQAYLAVDSTSQWAEEARQYEASLQWTPVSLPGATASDAALSAFAVASPQEAREFGWDTLLGQWGDAVRRFDTAAASTALHRAEVIGRALEAAGRDATLADQVRLLQARSSDKAATDSLAEAHRLWAAARKEYRDVQYSAADSLFDRAATVGAGSPLLTAWVRGFRPAAHRAEDPAASLRRARESVAGIDTLRYPALAMRAYWTLGVLLNKDNKAAAAEAYGVALRMAERADEDEYVGAIMGGAADQRFSSSDRSPVYYATWYEAASRLHRYRASQSLHRHLVYLTRHLVEDGFPLAARHLNDELAAVARRSGVDLLVVEAHDIRGESFARMGDLRSAREEIEAAQALLDSIDPRAQGYFSTTLMATYGVAEVQGDPRAAETRLSAAIRLLEPAGVPVRVTTLQLALADVRSTLGKTDSARADLEAALAMIRQGRVPRPVGLSQTAGVDVRRTLNRVVARMVAEGRDTAALGLLEYGAAMLRRSTPAPLPALIPSGRVVVRYAFAGDTILAWTLSGREVRVTPIPVPQARFRERLDTLLTLLEQHEDTRADADLRRLYNWLIRPLESRLGAPNSSLVIVPDETLANVPFPALTDGRQFLLDRFVLRVAGSVAGAAGEAVPDRASPAVGVVRDPAIDRQLYPDLHQLPGASGEVAALSRWPGATVLADSLARADSVRALLGRVSLFHFAGHAMADPLMPDSSFLVLAAGPGPDDLGRLTAADIASMRLPGLDLVVLSACSTLGGSEAGSGGFAGLSGAFLGAGAKGVIGSLWSVNDERTRTLVDSFYVAYRANHDPAAALRHAQQAMRNSTDPRWNRPSAWAAFEYAGR